MRERERETESIVEEEMKVKSHGKGGTDFTVRMEESERIRYKVPRFRPFVLQVRSMEVEALERLEAVA